MNTVDEFYLSVPTYEGFDYAMPIEIITYNNDMIERLKKIALTTLPYEQTYSGPELIEGELDETQKPEWDVEEITSSDKTAIVNCSIVQYNPSPIPNINIYQHLFNQAIMYQASVYNAILFHRIIKNYTDTLLFLNFIYNNTPK